MTSPKLFIWLFIIRNLIYLYYTASFLLHLSQCTLTWPTSYVIYLQPFCNAIHRYHVITYLFLYNTLPGALEKSLTSYETLFFLYFQEIRNKRSHWPAGQSAWLLYNCHNLCPCARPAALAHMWASAGQGPISSSPKQWRRDGCVKIYNSVSARSPLKKSKNFFRKRSNIKSTCHSDSALTGSVPQWRKKASGCGAASESFSTHQE